MTEPNRDDTLPAPHSPPNNPPAVQPLSPQAIKPLGPWHPDPAIPHPGIFTRDAVIPSATPGTSFIGSLRFLVPKVFGIDWYVQRRSDDSAKIWSRRPIDVPFEVAIRRPTNRGDDFITTVDHVVSAPDVAAALERLLSDHQERVSEFTALLVGQVRQPDPDKPSDPALLHVGIGNRWPVHPSSSEEHRLAEFVVWNIQIILWLRSQARRQIHLLLAAPRPAPSSQHSPEPCIAATELTSQRASELSIPPANPANTSPRSSLPSPLSKGWESIPWPLSGNPSADTAPWVGLCSNAVYQPLAFDPGYWLEFWTSHCDGSKGGVGLIEAIHRALPLYLDPEWRLEYRGSTRQFLRHPKHQWIFEIKERKFTGFRPEDAPSPFRIRPPGGPYCPTGTAYEVRLIMNSVEEASAVAQEICDRRAGTCDTAASFFRDLSPDSVRWGIVAQLAPFTPRAPAHSQRHARPGFDVSGWWDGDPLRRLPFQTLRIIWALKIFHESCLRQGLTPFSGGWQS